MKRDRVEIVVTTLFWIFIAMATVGAIGQMVVAFFAPR